MSKPEKSRKTGSGGKAKSPAIVVMGTDPDRERKTEYIGFRWEPKYRKQLAAAKQVSHMAEGDFLKLCFLKARKMVIEEVFEERKKAAEAFFADED